MFFIEARKIIEEESLVVSGEEFSCRYVRFDMFIRYLVVGYLNLEFRREVYIGNINLIVISI